MLGAKARQVGQTVIDGLSDLKRDMIPVILVMANAILTPETARLPLGPVQDAPKPEPLQALLPSRPATLADAKIAKLRRQAQALIVK